MPKIVKLKFNIVRSAVVNYFCKLGKLVSSNDNEKTSVELEHAEDKRFNLQSINFIAL